MNKQQKLDSLKKQMMEDQTLPLRKGAANLVFGEGDPGSEIMFIGEGPGYWEDLKSRPFVGNAGAFLNQLIITAGLSREGVFITNVVHHRPPENRDPESEEINAYATYLNKMIDIISPKVVVTLGRFSMAKFLPNTKISSIHGKSFKVDWKGKKILVVPMYHPAAGLRSTQVKQLTIDDFRKLNDVLNEAKEIVESSKKKNDSKAEQMPLI